MSRVSLVSTHCADSDIEKTYPAVQMAINGSKTTTMRELCKVEGMDYWGMRTYGFALIGGMPESMKFCKHVLELPTQYEMLDIFDNQSN